MDARTIRERNSKFTHIVVTSTKDGSCRFLSDERGVWTSDRFLAIQLSPERAEKLAEKLGGMAIERPQWSGF